MSQVLFLFLFGVAVMVIMLGLYQRVKDHLSFVMKPLTSMVSPQAFVPQKRTDQPLELVARPRTSVTYPVSCPSTTFPKLAVALHRANRPLDAARSGKTCASSRQTITCILLNGAPITYPGCGIPIEPDGKYCGQCGKCIQPDTRI